MNQQKHSDFLLEQIRTGQPLSRRQMLILIGSLSLPAILAQITSVLMFFIDAAMVGHLGAEPSASIGLVETTTWLFGAMTSAASMGFSVQVAHYIGANDFHQARQVFRHGLVVTLSLSVLLALVGLIICRPLPYWLGGSEEIAADATIYFAIFMLVMPFFQLNSLAGSMLKSSGDMRLPSIISVVMCVLDVAFNYVFIFIFNLGVMGAAIGTALSIAIVALVQGYFAIFRNKILALHQDAEGFRWLFDYVKNAGKIGAPMALQSFLMMGAQIISTIIVAPLGTIAIAANTLAITAESLCYMPGYGIGEAATTLVGQSIGAKRLELCRGFAWMAIVAGMAVMTLMGVFMFIFAPELMMVLSPVDAIVQLGAQCLRIEAFAEPMFAAAIVSYSICVGAGDTLRPAAINLASMWCVRLTLAALLATNYGLQGVWTAMAIELTVRGLLFLIRIARGSWMKTSLKAEI